MAACAANTLWISLFQLHAAGRLRPFNFLRRLSSEPFHTTTFLSARSLWTYVRGEKPVPSEDRFKYKAGVCVDFVCHHANTGFVEALLS